MKPIRNLTILVLTLVILSTVAGRAEEAAVPAEFGDSLSEHFLAEGAAPVVGDMSYMSENLAIEITTAREYRSDIYIADIWVRDLSLLRRGFGGGRCKDALAKHEGAEGKCCCTKIFFLHRGSPRVVICGV